MVANPLPDSRTPVLLSAHADDLIGGDAAAILTYLDARPAVTDVDDVAATLLRTRRTRRHRAVLRAADIGELRAGLSALAAGDEHPLLTRFASSAAGSVPRVAFVFPGQGSQWPSMGVDAYHRLPVYRAEADKCAAAFEAAGALSPLSYLLAADPTAEFTQVATQGAQFVHGVALAAVWRSCGVLPDITVGHSLGEIGAACVAGTITLSDAVGVVIARATLLDRLTGPYRVAVLGITPDEAQAVIEQTPGWLELSVVNSNSSVAVSGDCDAVAAAVRTVAERGAFAKEIEMWFPAHTTALDPLRADLEALLPTAEFTETPVQFIGSATADVVAPNTPFADYWYTNLRSTVRFDRAVAAAVSHGARTFVEMSAHPALLFAMGAVLDDLPDLTDGAAVLLGSGRRDEPIADQLAASIVAAALAEPGHRWADQADGTRRPLADFPYAPMRREHHWATAEPLPPIPGLTVAVEHWEALAASMPATGTRRAAILDSSAQGRVGAWLRAAVEGHEALELVDAADADLLIVVAPDVDGDADEAADELSRRIGDGLFGYVEAITAACRDVWLVTTGAERVDPSATGPRPGPAALAAMHRSVGLEYPDQRFRHLDLPADLPAAATSAVIGALLGDVDTVALRASASGLSAYGRSTRDETSRAAPWSADSGVFDDVVITGGGGAIGLHYARCLAERGTRRIVLLSRGGADITALTRLAERHGTEIVAPRCDITDAAALSAIAAEYGGDGASLVIHAAGAATIAGHRELTRESAHHTFAAKVVGLGLLENTWPMRTDARILLCSSVSGLWGGRGHAAYSAANRLLDVIAGQMRDRGRQCTSVRWGLWQGTGVIDADEIARVERSGLRAMQPERAVEESLRDHGADPLVFSADPDRLRAFLRAEPESGGPADAPGAADLDTSGLDTVGIIRAALGAVLKLTDTSGLDLDTSLLDLGVDSLLAIDLRKKLKKATGHNVPLARILGGATATELIEHLERPEKKALSRD
ncbi:mycobactin polyketide synthase MbtD [Mycolicibacterium sp. 624]|uniref:mycobactin polyketide synthase MbtD n=1 Tax=Mycolicibacterium sp. 624 TaxID=3156314 RepID=UPI00339449A2